MSAKTVTCIVIDCDTCGTDCWDDETGTPHFLDLTELLASGWFTGWGQDASGTPNVCESCWNQKTCELEGHDWSDWIDAVPNELQPPHRFRECKRCDNGLERKPVSA